VLSLTHCVNTSIGHAVYFYRTELTSLKFIGSGVGKETIKFAYATGTVGVWHCGYILKTTANTATVPIY